MTRARSAAPYLGLALFVAAGGYVHLREWLDHYRHLPSGVPGAWVVKVGFPVNAAVSGFLAVTLVVIAVSGTDRRVGPVMVGSTALFQLGSLAALILTRTGSVFGWSEQVWTRGAEQSRAVEIGALLLAMAVTALDQIPGRSEPRSGLRPTPGV